MGGGSAKVNALRSMVVVIGASAFGYLTLQLGFKPFLEKAQLEQQRQQEQAQQQAQHNGDDDDTFFHSSTTDTAATTLTDD